MSETWTVKRILDWAAADFKSKGMETPRLEAELLLSAVLGCDRMGLYTGFDRPVDGAERRAFKDALIRRRGGEPAAYILGVKEFWSLEFKVNPSVLIPRPETELLVERAAAAVDKDHRGRALDLCTGSGCVAVALAKEREGLTLDAVDISPQACGVASRNVSDHGLEQRVSVHCGDLFAPVEGEVYDIITANPPYVTLSELSTLSSEVKREPAVALTSGEDGLDAIRRILERGREFLAPGGVLLVEMDPRQTAVVARQLGPELFGLQGVIHADLAGLDRVVTWKVRV